MMRIAVVFRLVAALGCASTPSRPQHVGQVPAELVGDFEDDYGNAFRVSDTLFFQLPRARYHIVEWNSVDQYLIARNGEGNPSDAGLWTRIDWMPFTGMEPFTWGFCLTAYTAPSAAAARATPAAIRATPRTGCNGFPFSRMRRRAESGSGR
jgi:hypothetical protein